MIVIALGSNLSSHAGAPKNTLAATLARLADNEVRLRKVSRFYQSIAWPDPRDPSFVNAVAIIETDRDPQSLMALLHETEDAFGRVRGARNAPRTLDLDLIDYNGRVEAGPPVLPHPRIETRGFVLIPLREIAPRWRHPASGAAIDDLIMALPDDARAVTPLDASKRRL
jgi:2-amino-4-hydroxy-6-hydroxymethyldihydropteridine diphosphokinase